MCHSNGPRNCVREWITLLFREFRAIASCYCLQTSDTYRLVSYACVNMSTHRQQPVRLIMLVLFGLCDVYSFLCVFSALFFCFSFGQGKISLRVYFSWNISFRSAIIIVRFAAYTQRVHFIVLQLTSVSSLLYYSFHTLFQRSSHVLNNSFIIQFKCRHFFA